LDTNQISNQRNKRDDNRDIDFKLERYKYILQEIHSLNENLHKYLTLFQTLATVIIGGGISLFVGWQNLNISADVARAGIRSLLSLLVILTLYVVISILAGVFSWLDYRKEEVELLNRTVEAGFRQPPNIKNFWRWHETYLILFSIAIVISIYIYVESQIIPLIN
jgi:hypothetical protein